MKKVCLIVGYWLAAILLTTLLLLSLDYDLWVAVAMSLTFLPSAMALSFFLPKVDRAKRRNQRILDTIFIIQGVMTTAFLFIYVTQFLTYSSIGPTGFPEWDLPSMLGNPIFVAAVLALLAYGNYRLERWLEKRFPSDRPIVFTSDYHRVSVKKEDILYVESRDSEVWVFTWDGNQYRNKTGISVFGQCGRLRPFLARNRPSWRNPASRLPEIQGKRQGGPGNCAWQLTAAYGLACPPLMIASTCSLRRGTSTRAVCQSSSGRMVA